MSAMKRNIAVGLVLGALLTTATHAADVALHGFVRAGGAVSLGDQRYLERIDKNGDTGDSHFGLTASSALNDHWDVAGQIFSSAQEGGAVVLDWAYGTFRPVDTIKLSVGKIKYPNLLVSDYYDIGVSYLWIRPPQELYALESETIHLSLEAFNGASLIYDGVAGSVEYTLQVFGGDTKYEEEMADKLLGAKFRLGNDTFSVQAAYNQHTDVLPTESMDMSVISAGATLDVANFLVNAEYALGQSPDHEELETTAYYATLGYRLGDLIPHVTYAKLDALEGRDVVTLGVKYQIAPPATFKVEIAHIAPEAEAGESAESYQAVSAAFDFVF